MKDTGVWVTEQPKWASLALRSFCLLRIRSLHRLTTKNHNFDCGEICRVEIRAVKNGKKRFRKRQRLVFFFLFERWSSFSTRTSLLNLWEKQCCFGQVVCWLSDLWMCWVTNTPGGVSRAINDELSSIPPQISTASGNLRNTQQQQQ